MQLPVCSAYLAKTNIFPFQSERLRAIYLFLCTVDFRVVNAAQHSSGVTTHSVTVLEDFSLLKASWYLRLSTSFFIWGRSISSMAAACCRAFLPVQSGRRPQLYLYRALSNSRQTRSIHLCPAARTPQSASDLWLLLSDSTYRRENRGWYVHRVQPSCQKFDRLS